MKILVVQNINCETLGSLEGMIRSDGFEIEVVDASSDHIPVAPDR